MTVRAPFSAPSSKWKALHNGTNDGQERGLEIEIPKVGYGFQQIIRFPFKQCDARNKTFLTFRTVLEIH